MSRLSFIQQPVLEPIVFFISFLLFVFCFSPDFLTESREYQKKNPAMTAITRNINVVFGWTLR